MKRRNAVAAKLQSASQERSQTALRHHGSTTHVAYACASIEWLSMGACEQRAADSSAVVAVPNLSLTPTSELPPLTHEA